MTWPEWKRERLIVSFVGISSATPLIVPTDTRTSFKAFRNDCWNFLYLKSALNLIATLPSRHAAIRLIATASRRHLTNNFIAYREEPCY
jgi:hypothetical protein